MSEKRAAIYLRVSTEEQREGQGIGLQREACRALALVKGWAVVAEYSDEGISGARDEADRPGLAELMQAARDGAVDVVIFYALDRLGRSTRLILRVVEELADAGVELASCRESLDTSTPSGELVLTIFAGLAQMERKTIVARTTAGRNERGRRDGERGGRVPLGYLRVLDDRGKATGEIRIDPEGEKIVRVIFARKAEGLSHRAIARGLNAAGVLTARGGRWSHSGVSAVLGNAEKYAGGRRGESSLRWPVIEAVSA